MSVYTFQAAFRNNSDAEFRAWGSGIADGLLAGGWVKTADSGQIDWSTVTAPSGASANRGYEIWRMDDALQGAAPIFLKIEYGAHSTGVPGIPGIWTTVGSGSDGAGTITGTAPRREQIRGTAADGTATLLWVVSAAPNRVGVWAAVTGAAASTTIYFAVERTHDGSGLDTVDGFTWQGSNDSGAGHHQYYSTAAASSPGREDTAGVFPPTIGTGSDGVTTSTYPAFITRGPYCNPPRAMLGAFGANFTPATTIQIPMYGALVTYYVPAAVVFSSVARYATANATQWLIRYD